jgi:hypothetical protein
MARSRILESDVFNDPDLNQLPPLARWLYLGLLTIADREGRLVDDPRRIKVLVLPFDDADCDALLTALAPSLITRYRVGDLPLIQIRSPFSVHPRETISVLPAQGEPRLDASNLGVKPQTKVAISVSDSVSIPVSIPIPIPVSVSNPVSVSSPDPRDTMAQIQQWRDAQAKAKGIN